jgi:hypothetical protein
MAVSVHHTQVRSVIGGSTPYQVVDTVDSSVNIEKEVFLLSVVDDSFVQVASAAQMLNYPVSKVTAIADNKQFYRTATVTLAFASVIAATRSGGDLIDRMQLLVAEYKKLSTTFAGTTVGDITSG